MKLRIAVLDLPRRIQDHAAEVEQMRKRDDGHRKLFELAASASAPAARSSASASASAAGR